MTLGKKPDTGGGKKPPRKEEFLDLDMRIFRDVIFVEDMNFKVSYVSPSVTALFGYTVEEILRLGKKDFITPDSLARAQKKFQKFVSLAETEGDFDIPLMEYQYIRKDGSTFWGELKVTFLRDSEGCLIGSQGILRDIDERKKMEESLRQSELKCRTLFHLSPQAIALTELTTGRLVDVNEKFCRLTQYPKDELIGKPTTDLGFYSKEDRERFLEVLLASGEVQGMEMDFKARDGSGLNAQMFSKVIELEHIPHVLNVFYDRTQEKRLEHQFLQAQKMESVGNLAGGIAHDFNNLLMGIEGNVSLMLLDTEVPPSHYPMLREIKKHVRSCAQLTRQLLGYARKGKYEVVPLDVNRLIEETSTSFQRSRKQIRVHKELAGDVRPVEVDAVQIEQVLYNLYFNAADAMPMGGELFLKTSNISHKEMTGRIYRPKRNDYVSITITDTGVGMDRRTLDHIFEPFFTTKDMGKGTGLGLASVYGIVKGHGGYIDVDSEQGKGTAFSIYLPASDKEVKKPVPMPERPIKTTGTVMIVDDEKSVLDVGSRMLAQMGFNVLRAESGSKAVESYRARAAEIDLVILDVIMPGMDAGEVYDRIKEISPNAKVLLSSGYGTDGRITEILERGCDGFIPKPFGIEELSQKISEILKIE